MPTRFLKLAKQFFAISQTVFGARDPRRTRLPPSKGKTSFAKHHKSYAFSQHDLCIKPKPHLAKLKFASSFLTLATPCFAISQPVLSAKNRKKLVYLPRKVQPHLPNIPKFVRLANTICALSQNRIWRSPGQIEDLKFTKSVSELRQADFCR